MLIEEKIVLEEDRSQEETSEEEVRPTHCGK